MNICANCIHRCVTTGDGSNILSNHCGAPEVGFDPAINPVTGEMCWKGTLDEGEMFCTNVPTPLCIYINPLGECPYFEDVRQLVWFSRAMMN